MRHLAAASLAFTASIATTAVRAQVTTSTDSTETGSWMIGGTIMIPQVSGMSGAEFTTVGFTVSPPRPNRLGPELAFVVVPYALGFGVVAGAVRANVGVPIQLGQHMLLVPSAGLTFIGGLGSGVGGGSKGVNGTLAVVFFADSAPASGTSIGLRAALAVHQFGDGAQGQLRMFELGIVRWKR